MEKCVIAIDPGRTTGIAVMLLTDNNFELLSVQQLQDPDYVWEPILKLIEEMHSLYEDVHVICESFEMRPDVIDPDETPKFIIKDLQRYVEPHYEINYQTASQAKVGVPPARSGRKDRLHAFGLYQRGLRHANDSVRHIVAYALDKLQHRPLIIAGWGAPVRK